MTTSTKGKNQDESYSLNGERIEDYITREELAAYKLQGYHVYIDGNGACRWALGKNKYGNYDYPYCYHRHDGPAVMTSEGIHFYWIYGIRVSPAKHAECKDLSKEEWMSMKYEDWEV